MSKHKNISPIIILFVLGFIVGFILKRFDIVPIQTMLKFCVLSIAYLILYGALFIKSVGREMYNFDLSGGGKAVFYSLCVLCIVVIVFIYFIL